ncbi:hypothetical protein [Bordetella bronchiseptica]|uniref:hypothetical protein n=1 Tax=Bordetella bronchiseptica TaxID=518 RepID=UPI000FDBABFB|nr:hypothetical protein [Bordetella bronchiseptica]
MPRDNNGNYAPQVNSWNPAGPNGALAAPADFDALRTDMANEIGNSLDRSGRGGMLADLPMNNNRLLLLGQPQGSGNALRWEQLTKGSDIASSATLPIPVEGAYFVVTGTTTITAFSDVYEGRAVRLKFQNSLTLKHSSSLVLPNDVDLIVRAGDIYEFLNSGAGIWTCLTRSHLSGEIIQQVSFTTTGSTRTSTTPGNAQAVTLTVKPKSTNSILVLNCNFYAGIAPSAGNPLGSWRIYETTGTPTPIGTGLRSLYSYMSGGSGMGLEAMGHILVPDLANTSLAERRFLLYSWTNQATSAVRTETINYTVTEVAQ